LWTTSSSDEITIAPHNSGNAHSGDYSLFLSANGGDDGLAIQQINVCPGTTYHPSLWIFQPQLTSDCTVTPAGAC